MQAEAEAKARSSAQAEGDRWARAWAGRQETSAEDPDPEDSDAWPLTFLFQEALPGSDAADDFSLYAWLFEGLRGLRSYARQAGLDEEFWQHMRAAEREFLLAWRSLIDARLRRLERQGQPDDAASQRLQPIEIDFGDSPEG